MSRDGLLSSVPDDIPLRQIWLSAFHAPAIALADEFGIFRKLAIGPAAASDLFATRGRQRTANEIIRILSGVGFTDVSVRPTVSGYAVIEGLRSTEERS